ncbi:MAG: septum formation family protein [Acidimicrobiales bacterium]
MTSVHTATRAARPGLAIGGGVLAGIITVAAVSGLLWFSGRSNDEIAAGDGPDGIDVRIGTLVAGAGLLPADCINFTGNGGNVSQFSITECESPHLAQVTGKIEHPDAGGEYPGADAMADWVGGQCTSLTESFIGSPILETTLADGALVPDFDDWSSGDFNTACYVTNFDSTSLTSSVEGRGSDFPRGDQVVISRLIEGDCFAPIDGTNSYDLNSNSTVDLVSCDGEHNGVFFGRAQLDFPIGSIFPGEDEVGDATSGRCSELFGEHFSVASDGFNYRYWRPNQQSWALQDRAILCAVLDSDPLVDRFEPAQYDRFFDLAMGQCFNLGPEETSDSLRLDDQVRLVDCSASHVGQMIGSGDLELDLTEPFPADEGVLQLAGAECERLFVDFVGESPYDSELGNFPFWYPNEPGWDEGDRRYACAFLDSEPRSESLENAGA